MKVRKSSGAHETQREWVYHSIRFALMAGRYAPGEKLTIAQVTAQLGVSMTPVREALRRLAAERALEMSPNRSVTVPKLSREEVLAVRRIRELLEGHAAGLAARRMTPAQIEHLERLGKELEQARARRDARRILLFNERFHFALYEAAGVRVLTEIIATLWLQSAPTLNVIFRPENIGRYPLLAQNRHNRALLRALRRHDGRAAARAVAAEIALGSRMLERIMPSAPGG